MSEEKTYELVEIIDEDDKRIPGLLPGDCQFEGVLEKTVVVVVDEQRAEDMVKELERIRLRERALKGYSFLILPPGVKFLKLREVK